MGGIAHTRLVARGKIVVPQGLTRRIESAAEGEIEKEVSASNEALMGKYL